MRGVRRTLLRDRRIEPLRGGGDRRNRAQSRLHLRDGLDAAADLPRQGSGASLARIIQNQYFIHRWSSVEIMQNRTLVLRPRNALSNAIPALYNGASFDGFGGYC